MDEIIINNPNTLIDPQAQMVVNFLETIGLPSDNIIADKTQRDIIGNNLPYYIDTLPPEIKRDARYLSKFVVGAVVGLFDYSLNAIWNEVVLDLRKKAILYGLDIFFDAAVGGGRTREFYSSEDDLSSLKDSVLLDTVIKLELISDTTYKKLKHVLDMRNDIGISHPTSYSINAFELLGWLQTCIQDVLNDQPTEAAIQVQHFIKNLKTNTELLNEATVKTIQTRLSELPSHMCGNILRTVFGIYVSADTNPVVRKNISLIATSLWENCLDEPKYKLGIVLEGYNNNLHLDKHKLGGQFFEIVNGNSYRSTSERSVILSDLITELMDKHNGWDNFHNEGPVAANIASYIPDQNSIFENLAERLFKTVMICRIGRNVNYCNGISPKGKVYYDHLLLLAGDKYAHFTILALYDQHVSYLLAYENCRIKIREALEIVKRSVINQRINECLEYLIKNIEKSPNCITSTEFKKLSKNILLPNR
jgi:hypothetical protein